jgi:hypothetical protein
MKDSDEKVDKAEDEDFEELSELEQQRADEEMYFEIFGELDDDGPELSDILVIVPDEEEKDDGL